MEFKSLNDLVRIAENALAVQFYGQSSILRKSVLKVLAYVIGGLLYMMSLIAKRIWKNRFVTTCDVSALDGFGAEYGLPHKVPLAASGSVTVTLDDGVASVTIPQGTILVDSTRSLEYEVKADKTISVGNNSIDVVAVENGYGYNLDAGTILSFRDDPISSVSSMTSVDVSGGVAEGVEIDGEVQVWGETAEEYRARLLNRVQNPPNGTSANDYWLKATRFSFVTDAFVFSNQPNTNSVSVACANYHSSSIALTSTQIGEVSNYIADDVRRCVTTDVRVFSVTPVGVTMTVSVTPYNEANRDSVKKAILSYLRKVKPGTTVSFGDIEDYVRANSSVKVFAVQSVKKNNSVVQNLAFTLDLSDDDNPIAEVARITNSGVEVVTGE